jgi:hypothetical protein
MAQLAASVWSSLEVVKLVVAALTPLAVGLLGLYIKRVGQRIEDNQWSGRKLVEKRLELYDDMAPDLNDLYCCFVLVGDFRAITPPDAIALKRKLDKTFHINRHLFDPEFENRYKAFMELCFITNESVGSTARLRADLDVQRDERGPSHWDTAWEPMLLSPGETGPGRREIIDAYNGLMHTFADEVGVTKVKDRI